MDDTTPDPPPAPDPGHPPEQPPHGGHPRQPYPYPQYPYPPYPPPAPPLNTYAILALVFGVMVFPPLGIYFGGKAKQQIAETGERGVELATAGIVVGWIFTILYGVFLVIWCGLVGTMLSTSTV